MKRSFGALVLFFGWLAFRGVCDWGRGLRGSDIAVPEWTTQVNYFGLVAWLIVATPVVLFNCRLRELLRSDVVVRAQAMFLVVQSIGFGVGVSRFGMNGFVAGAYILGVSVSFLYIYVLGLHLGEHSHTEQPTLAMRRNLLLLTWALGPSLLIAGIQLVTGTGRDVEGVGSLRLYGGTSSPNVLAALLLVFMSAFVWSEHRLQLGRLLVAAFSMVTFVACFSLTGFGALAFAAVLYFVLRAYRTGKIRVHISWIIAGLVALYLVATLAGAILAVRLGEFSESDNSFTWRVRTWLDYFEALSEPKALLFGGGLGIDHLYMEQEPHNEWLRVTAEAGLLGLVFFSLTWVRLFTSLRSVIAMPDPALQQQATALLATTTGLMLWGLGDSVLRTAPSALLVWAMAGLLIGSARSYYLAEAPASVEVGSLGGRDSAVEVPG